MPKTKSKIEKVDKKTKDAATGKKDKKNVYLKQLPDWFDLNNYKGSYKLDLEGWITQISLRTMAKGFLKKVIFTGIVDDFQLTKLDGSENPITEMEVKGNAPVHDLTLNEAIRIAEVVKMLKIFSPEAWEAPSFYENFFERGETKGLIETFNELNGTDSEKLKYYPLNFFYRLPIHNGLIDVNLTVPDKILLKFFKKWLADKRKYKNGYELFKKTHTKSILRRWATNQVLPFVDLSYWAELHGVEVPHWLMADALFPGKYEGDKIEKVRKTTKKNAEEVLHPASLYAMCAQYKHENSMDIVTECFDAILPDRVEIKNRIFLSD